MASERLFESTKIDGPLVDMRAQQRVILWDLGPAEPKLPKRPKPPVRTAKPDDPDPEYDLAAMEFKEELERYEAALRAYRAQRDEHEKFQRDNGGPIERVFWSPDAYDALAADERAVKENRQPSRRWYISSRTRGYSHLKNHGLPVGMKAGHGQAEQRRREQEGDAEMAAALQRDPVFGHQELRE